MKNYEYRVGEHVLGYKACVTQFDACCGLALVSCLPLAGSRFPGSYKWTENGRGYVPGFTKEMFFNSFREVFKKILFDWPSLNFMVVLGPAQREEGVGALLKELGFTEHGGPIWNPNYRSTPTMSTMIYERCKQ